MTHDRKTRVIGGLVGFVVAAGGVLAHVPPPGAATPVTPEWVPPPQPDPSQIKRQAPPAEPEDNEPVKDWRDKDGKLAELTEPLYWACMRRNTLISGKAADDLQPFFDRRKHQYENIVVDNVDLVRKIIDGAIEKANEVPEVKEEGREPAKRLSQLNQILKPLVGDNIRKAVQDAGSWTKLQSSHTDKVSKAYASEQGRDIEAKFPPLAADANDEQKKERARKISTQKMMARVYGFIDESMWAYTWLLDETAKNWTAALAKTDFDAATKAKLNAAFKDVKATKASERFEQMKKVMKLITPEQERTLLQGTISLRPTQPGPAAKPAGTKASDTK